MDFTYTITPGGGTHPTYGDLNSAVADFKANDRMGAGAGVVPAASNLIFNVTGKIESGNASQSVSGITRTNAATSLIWVGGTGSARFNANPANVLELGAALNANACGFTFGQAALELQDGVQLRDIILLGFNNSGYAVLEAWGPNTSIESCIAGNLGTGYCAHTRGDVKIRNLLAQGDGNTQVGIVTTGDLATNSNATIEHLTVSLAAGSGVDCNQLPLPSVKNSFFQCGAGAFGGGMSGAVADHNASSGSDAPGTNPTNNVSGGSYDGFKVQPTSVLLTTGAPRLSGTTTDIFGTARAVTTTIGAFAAETGGGDPPDARIRPSSDVSVSGWVASTGTDRFAMVDEAARDNGDYVLSPALSATPVSIVWGLANGPLAAGNWHIPCTLGVTSGTGTATLRLVNDAGAVQGTSAPFALTTADVDRDIPITTSGAATRVRVDIVAP